MKVKPKVWFPLIRARSGSDVFTRRLSRLLEESGIRCEIHELPHWTEYAPRLHGPVSAPPWANITHINSWLPARFLPESTATVTTVHHVVHLYRASIGKGLAQHLYHRHVIAPRERQVLDASDVVTTVSQHSAQDIRAFFGVPPHFVVPNWIDKRVFFPHRRPESHRPFRLLFPGNWSLRKGADLLAPIMRDLGPEFELLTTGLRNRSTGTRALPANIRRVPSPRGDHEMAALYRSCDALLFPSRLEGFGLAALEAQACGLPVIATNGSALPEVVADRQTGLLCRADDVSTLVSAVRRLRQEPGTWRMMSSRAADRAAETFDSASALKAYLRVYQQALEHTRKRR